MLLYLLRHAEAVPKTSSDALRALSDKGVTQAKLVGRFCLRNGLVPEVILTSPLRRAEQTARHFAEEIHAPEIVTVAMLLAAGMDPETALGELMEYKKLNSVMMVGHEPDLGQLASRLLGIDDVGKIYVRKASLTLIELNPAQPRSAVLHFSIPVKLM